MYVFEGPVSVVRCLASFWRWEYSQSAGKENGTSSMADEDPHAEVDWGNVEEVGSDGDNDDDNDMDDSSEEDSDEEESDNDDNDDDDDEYGNIHTYFSQRQL
jgi:hypothetical protein